MPERTDIRSILIIGAGPIVIGKGFEFQASGWITGQVPCGAAFHAIGPQAGVR